MHWKTAKGYWMHLARNDFRVRVLSARSDCMAINGQVYHAVERECCGCKQVLCATDKVLPTRAVTCSCKWRPQSLEADHRVSSPNILSSPRAFPSVPAAQAESQTMNTISSTSPSHLRPSSPSIESKLSLNWSSSPTTTRANGWTGAPATSSAAYFLQCIPPHQVNHSSDWNGWKQMNRLGPDRVQTPLGMP